MWAASNGHAKVLPCLLENGAHPNFQNIFPGTCVLCVCAQVCVVCVLCVCVEIICICTIVLLLRTGLSALHYACANGYIKCVEIFLAGGARMLTSSSTVCVCVCVCVSCVYRIVYLRFFLVFFFSSLWCVCVCVCVCIGCTSFAFSSKERSYKSS